MAKFTASIFVVLFAFTATFCVLSTANAQESETPVSNERAKNYIGPYVERHIGPQIRNDHSYSIININDYKYLKGTTTHGKNYYFYGNYAVGNMKYIPGNQKKWGRITIMVRENSQLFDIYSLLPRIKGFLSLNDEQGVIIEIFTPRSIDPKPDKEGLVVTKIMVKQPISSWEPRLKQRVKEYIWIEKGRLLYIQKQGCSKKA